MSQLLEPAPTERGVLDLYTHDGLGIVTTVTNSIDLCIIQLDIMRHGCS